jgi:hypothetical protein
VKRQVKRLHSEDARLLRSMLYDILRRVDDIETALGHLQHVTGTLEKINVSYDQAEILEGERITNE